MGLETATNFDELVASWPLGNDDVSQGDDHIRLVKSVLQDVFPSNDGVGSFPGMDFFLRDIDIRTATISGEILENAQVAIASTTIDGVTGAITGPSQGIIATQRTGNGLYEIQLSETGWASYEDLQAGFIVNYSLAGFGILGIGPAVVNPASSWIRCLTAPAVDPSAYADCALFHIVLFDAGRD